jgi:hypothetical protein
MANQNGEEHEIFVNKKLFKTLADSLTGTEILGLAALTPDQYDLFLVVGERSRQIQPGESVGIENGEHFNAITKGVNFGCFRGNYSKR